MSSEENTSNTRQVVRGASITFLGMIFQLGMSFVSGIIVTRMIGPSAYGVFSLARTLCESVTIFTKLGFDIGIVRYFGENVATGRAESNARFLKLVLTVVLGLSLIPVLAIYLGGGVLLERNVYKYPDFAQVMMAMILSVPFMALTQVLGGAFRGTLRIRPRVIAELFMQPSARLLIIVFLFLLGWRLWAAIVGTVLSFAIVTAYLLVLAKRGFFRRAERTVTASPESALPWRELVTVGKYSIVISLTVAVAMLLAKADIIMLGYFSSADQVGQYAVMQMIVGLILLSNAALNQAVAPMLARLHKEGNSVEMRRLIHQHARWVMITSLPMFLIIAAFGAHILRIFGNEFAVESSALALLALAQLVLAVLSSAGFMLSMTGRHMLEFYTMFIALVCNIVLNYLLIPEMGIMGAAIGTLSAVVLANVLRSMQVYKVHGFFPVGKEAVMPFLIGVGSFVGMLTATRYFEGGQSLSHAVLMSAAFVLIYIVLVVKFGLNREDRLLLDKIMVRLGLKRGAMP